MKRRPSHPALWILAARRRPVTSAEDRAMRRSDRYAAMSPGERLQRALELSTFCRLLSEAGDRTRSRQ
jgi:hypothetical protein